MKWISVFVMVLPLFIQAQLPTTELWALNIESVTDTALQYSNLRYLSHHNQGGYNNQIFPHADGYALTVAKFGHDQTDICFFNLELNSYQYLTSTRSTSEYSPYISEKDSCFYVVRVDTAGHQNLWALPLNLQHGGHNVLPGIDNVGYFEPIDDETYAVFLTGEPHQLAIATKGEGSKYIFTSNIGRCLQHIDGQVYFVHKLTPNSWYLKAYDVKRKKSSIISWIPHMSEDFFIKGNHVWMTHEGKILRFSLTGKKEWIKMADLSSLGLNNLTRLTIHNDILFLTNKKS